MILDNMSVPSTGDSEGKYCDYANESTSSVASSTTKMVKTETVEASNPTSSVSAINPNTFVVKLKPSPAVTNVDGSPQRKTNLLEIFGENNKGKNISVVKALGRIVINRTLLKNSKNKPGSTASPISGQTTIAVASSRATRPNPIVLRGINKENKDRDRKDDDISGNLANFMNFKLTGLVPPPPARNQFNTSNTFQVKLNAPEIKLSEANRDVKSSNILEGTRLVTVPSSSKKVSQSLGKDDDDSDDLTSLSWLTSNDKNLLKTIRSCNPDDAGICLSDDESEEEQEDEGNNKNNAVFTAKSRVDSGNQVRKLMLFS